jgi:hypothetical protein
VDRHLFSLASLEAELGLPTSPLFANEAWGTFNTSVLSTSNVNGGAVEVLGFGAGDPS